MLEIDITKTAIYIRDPQTHCLTIALSPSWTVYVINPSSKRYCAVELNKYEGIVTHQIQDYTGKSLHSMPMHATGKSMEFGIPVQLYGSSKEFADEQVKQYKRKELLGFEPKDAQESCFVGPGFPSQAGLVLSRFCGIPVLGGVPSKFTYTKLHGLVVVYLSTRSMTKKNLDIKVPQGYERVKTVQEARMDKSTDQGVEQLLYETKLRLK